MSEPVANNQNLLNSSEPKGFEGYLALVGWALALFVAWLGHSTFLKPGTFEALLTMAFAILLILFLQKKEEIPNIMIWLGITLCVLGVAEGREALIGFPIGSALAAYFFLSKRVKNTFVN